MLPKTDNSIQDESLKFVSFKTRRIRIVISTSREHLRTEIDGRHYQRENRRNLLSIKYAIMQRAVVTDENRERRRIDYRLNIHNINDGSFRQRCSLTL